MTLLVYRESSDKTPEKTKCFSSNSTNRCSFLIEKIHHLEQTLDHMK